MNTKEAEGTGPLVTIGVCTRKRPEMVVKCLRSLFELETSFKYDIVVVENDEEQTARKEIESLKPEASSRGIELRYYCEPEQNISIARNRCASECRGEFLAFIDDDEWADPLWLQSLVDVQRETGADVVSGVVTPVFEEGFPSYLRDFFYIKSLVADFAPLTFAPTGAILYKKEILSLRTPVFNVAYGKTGGEDADLSLFLSTMNKKIFGTVRAKAYEFQSLQRGKMWWLFERNLRTSLITSRLYYSHYYPLNGTRVNIKNFLIITCRIIKTVPYIAIKPRWAFVQIGINIFKCLGIIAFYLGFYKEGYR
ncbi:MAG: glycosyltransferase family 2 protein [Planctomycetia bacterium]|nr:glycosyltransferase family 2 protein [Planctomycetia bacterium]